MMAALPHDIYDLAGYGILWYEWLLITLVVFVIIAVIYALVRWRRGRPVKASEASPVDPFDRWEAVVRSLRPEPPFTRKQQEEFYYQLSLALRHGIELATRLPATDLTYKELRQVLSAESVDLPLDKQELLRFLNQSDHVKFAEEERTMNHAEDDRQRIGGWIRELRRLGGPLQQGEAP